MTIRARAAMAAGTVQDEPRQDERHAGDPHHVRKVLGGQARVGSVSGGTEVNHHVQHATGGHHQQADEHERRQSPEREQRVYHQHVLVIHRREAAVNCIDRIHM